MKNKKSYLLVILVGLAMSLYSQPQVIQDAGFNADTATVNALLQQSKDLTRSDPDKALNLATQAKTLAEKIEFSQGEAYALKSIGQLLKRQGKYLEALDHYRQSIKIFEEINDNVGVSNLYNNIGNVYYDQSDDVKALENYLQSLKYAELSGDRLRMLSALNNIGGVYTNKEATYDKALQYYLKALPICEEIGKKEELGAICSNIGFIYAGKKDVDKAMIYFNKALQSYGNSEGSLNVYNYIGKLYNSENKFDLALKNHSEALAIAEKFKVKISIVKSLIGLGNVYEKKGDYKTAIINYKKAETLALEIGASLELKQIYEKMSASYAKSADYGNAFRYQSLYSNIKDTIYNIENDKKLSSLQFDFDLQKKQNEISLLTKDKDLQAAKIKRQQLAKNAFMVGLVLAFIIALLIYRGYRNKVKTHKILDKQKNEIEHLLLNILPTEVAHELKTKGRATPRQYESVSVMFTDFKGFTTIADKMPPDDLVKELDDCFIAFDGVIEKYNLEKIKTIGDSYMCAGGIPTPDETHVLKIVKAGLEIQQYVASYNERRQENGLEPWLVRIGIHVGPVVAGVVGKKKYAYDIWGSTVNIASRMESNGEPGKVNISSATYEWIKDYYECSYRGKISAKNIGEIDMYFIEHEHRIPLNLTNTEEQVINQ
jgi:class 3 adenylate cyclase/tetratricopeptide (TPR) repeat protein